jgi:hypothetical protein
MTTRPTEVPNEGHEALDRAHERSDAHDVPAVQDVPEGIAEIDIATGRTIREEHTREPGEPPRR